MSEEYYTSIDMIATPLAEEVAQAAGITLGALAAGTATLTASMLERLAQAATRSGEHLTSDTGDAHHEARQTLDRLNGTLSALQNECGLSLLAAAVEKSASGVLAHVASQLATARATMSQGGAELSTTLASDLKVVSRELNLAIDHAAGRLLNAEASVLRNALASALGDCGYQDLRTAPAPGGALYLTATHRETTMYVELDPRRGQINVDISGLRGTACEQVRDRFLRALRARGLPLRVLQRHLHGDPKGGTLLRRTEAAFRAARGAEPIPLTPPRRLLAGG